MNELLSQAEAQSFIVDRYGVRASALTVLGAGQWSRAYAFTLDGREAVVRFGACADDFAKDHIMAGFSSPQLPVPSVMEYGQAPRGYFAVSERAHGVALDDLDETGMRTVLPSLLAALDAIGDIDVSANQGYGIWAPDGAGSHHSWPQALLSVAEDRDRIAGRQGVVAAQAEVGAKTNEIPMIIPLLDGLSLDGAVVTADALHTQRATADYVHGRGADFAFPVKDNQPGLFDALDGLPWRDVPVTHAATDRGHGRITTRTIQVMDAPGGLPFPHVSQVYLIERHVTGLDGTPLSEVAALGVTSLTTTRAGPETIAGLVRGQWAIESLHWLRDTLYREDNSQARTRSGPRAWPPSETSPSGRST